jgi:hypothetical protein
MMMEANTTTNQRRHHGRRRTTTYRMMISMVVIGVILCGTIWMPLPVATAESESESASSSEAKEVIPESATTATNFESQNSIVEEEAETSDADADADELLAEELLADEIAKETIEAGRGHRDERGVRDQWESDEHLTSESISKFDTKKGRPISNEVKRLLKQYRLGECNGCDHNDAVKKVNRYVRETKRITKLENERKEKHDTWAHRIFTSLVVIGLSLSYIYRKVLLTTLLGDDYETRIRRITTGGGGGNGGGNDLSGFTETQRTEIMRLRRQHASDAATKRQQHADAVNVQPTWLENEKKEIWTTKQEKQFQKAFNEFSGIQSKKEKYKLISDKVDGKSRIECMTHHRMKELLLEKQQQ